MHSLSRHQAHELNAMVRWLCVCAFIIVTQPGLLRFRTACDASRAFQKHLAAAVFSFEGWASWGTPKGRGAHAAYSRRAARRQTWLLVLLCAPTWIMNVASCHDPITLPGAREQGGDSANSPSGSSSRRVSPRLLASPRGDDSPSAS